MRWELLAVIITSLASILATVITVFGGFKLVEFRVRNLESQNEKQLELISQIPVIKNDVKNLDRRITDIERSL